MYLGFLAQDIHRNSQPVFTQSQMHYFHTFDKRIIFPELDGVIFSIVCSNFSGFGPRSSRGTSLKLLPCVVGWHWAFERRTLWDLFTPCPAEVIAMYMEKSLNLGKDLVGWMDGWSSSLLLCDVKGGEVPLLVFSHQECKLAESLSIVPASGYHWWQQYHNTL